MLALHPTFQVALSISAMIGLVGTPLFVPSVRTLFSELGIYAKTAYAAGLAILVSFALSSTGLVPTWLTLRAIGATIEVAFVLVAAYGIGLGLVTVIRGGRPAYELNRVTHASLHIGAGLAPLAFLSALGGQMTDTNGATASFVMFALIGAWVGWLGYQSRLPDARAECSHADDADTTGEADDAEGADHDGTEVISTSGEDDAVHKN